eukprot:UN10314
MHFATNNNNNINNNNNGNFHTISSSASSDGLIPPTPVGPNAATAMMSQMNGYSPQYSTPMPGSSNNNSSNNYGGFNNNNNMSGNNNNNAYHNGNTVIPIEDKLKQFYKPFDPVDGDVIEYLNIVLS